jgi:hypothetical protein
MNSNERICSLTLSYVFQGKTETIIIKQKGRPCHGQTYEVICEAKKIRVRTTTIPISEYVTYDDFFALGEIVESW